MTSSLVGSEMCIRDRAKIRGWIAFCSNGTYRQQCALLGQTVVRSQITCPVSYTHLTLPTICSV
eukprot:7807513-Prorocentrum_lima.AAC.1